MHLPINIETLLSGKVVETDRLEFKKGWNPAAIMRTVCAFANDFENLGSGYIVVGVEEENGIAKRPVLGFPAEQFDKVQKEMLGYARLMRPEYFPKLFLEEIDGKQVLVIWVPAGEHRPYEVPRDLKAKQKVFTPYVRQYSNTIEPNAQQKQELLSLTATIPFDDRGNQQVSIKEVDRNLVLQHLEEIGSKLAIDAESIEFTELLKQMNLTLGADEHLLPKNIALMFFSKSPEKYFPYARIEVAIFPRGLTEDFQEKIFEGPFQKQLTNALDFLKNHVLVEKVHKVKGQAEAERFWNFPYDTLEETLANAVYHRNYEIREPIEVRVLPDKIEITSHGGSDPAIKAKDFDKGVIRVRRYRNRRIGEFLKELKLTEGKGTGIPTMKRAMSSNGSPDPIFDMDGDDRRYFLVELPIHASFSEPSNQASDQVDVLNSNILQTYKTFREALSDQVSNQVGNQAVNEDEYAVYERMIIILKEAKMERSRAELLESIELSNQTKNFQNYMEPLLKTDLIARTIPEKPNSPKQKYVTTGNGNELLKKIRQN
jgi:ATP-dependent DNA helicase RecG|tara:strand:- start:1829 stop:3457 length:1629 start_codon:yes stop_codon:yes gene_type:complete